MKRVSENPPARFPDRPICEAEGIWWIAKVKPRQDKAFAFDLMTRDIEFFMPMYTHITRRKDNNKPRKSLLPLFAGYVSYCVPQGTQRSVFTTDRVVNIVEVGHQKHFIDQLDQVYRSITCGMALEPLTTLDGFEPGSAVEVTAGPLRGIQGVIARVKNGQRLILHVESLGRAAVTVDANQVTLI